MDLIVWLWNNEPLMLFAIWLPIAGAILGITMYSEKENHDDTENH